MKRRGRDLLPRYTRPKRLKNGKTAYFFEVPKIYREAGCTVSSEALGPDYVAACKRVNEALLPAFDSWRTGGASDVVPKRAAAGTFDWLVAEFKKYHYYRDKSVKTQRSYDQGLELVARYQLKDGRHFGSLHLKQIDKKVVVTLYSKLRYVEERVTDPKGNAQLDRAGKPLMITRERRATANAAMRACRRAWNVVKDLEPDLVPNNPFTRLELPSLETGKTPTASYDELWAFVRKADELGYASLGTAALIAWEWLPRAEDVFRTFMVEHYRPKHRPDAVQIIHSKTDDEAWIPLFMDDGTPLYPELMQRLDEIKRERIGGLMIVRDHVDRRAGTRLPWATKPTNKDDGLGYVRGKVREIIRAAGLREELSFRSFRHGGMTEAGEAGLTDREIQAQSRHRTVQVIPTYSKHTQNVVKAGAEKRRESRTKGDKFSE